MWRWSLASPTTCSHHGTRRCARAPAYVAFLTVALRFPSGRISAATSPQAFLPPLDAAFVAGHAAVAVAAEDAAAAAVRLDAVRAKAAARAQAAAPAGRELPRDVTRMIWQRVWREARERAATVMQRAWRAWWCWRARSLAMHYLTKYMAKGVTVVSPLPMMSALCIYPAQVTRQQRQLESCRGRLHCHTVLYDEVQ